MRVGSILGKSNGEVHVNTYGTPDGKPVKTGHSDFKPSWSKTGDMLVFFRRLKNDRADYRYPHCEATPK